MNTSIRIFISFFIFILANLTIGSESQAKTKKHSPSGVTVEFLISHKEQKAESGFMAKLTIPAKGKVPEHRDPTEEYLYVLSGSGTIWINDIKRSIAPGDSVFMPANAKVKFEANNKPVTVLQFFAPRGPEKKYDSWKSL